jgi:hypothetical protein
VIAQPRHWAVIVGTGPAARWGVATGLGRSRRKSLRLGYSSLSVQQPLLVVV